MYDWRPARVYVMLAWASGVALLLGPTTGVRADLRVPRGYDDRVETLARGVEAWEQTIETIEGLATAQIYVSDREIEAQKRDDPATTSDEPPTTRYTNNGLCVCRFFLGPDRWRCELAEPVPCGVNPWGMPVRGMRGRPLAEVESAAGCPIGYSVSDGKKVVEYNAAIGAASVRPYALGDDEGMPMEAVRSSLLLTAASAPLGRSLRRLIHSEYSSRPTQLVKVTDHDPVGDTDCWRLDIYFDVDWGGLIRYRVWIAPERGYMSMAFESLIVEPDNRYTGLRRYKRVLNGEEVAPGVWLPTEALFSLSAHERNRASNWWRIYRVKYQDLVINQPEPSFDVIPPLGTHVEDYRPDHTAMLQLGQLDRALREYKEADPPELDAERDGPLTGREFDEAFPP